MGYTRPGVEITQVQSTTTPLLTTPDLESCVIGDGFWIQDITWEDSSNPLKNSVAPQTITVSGQSTTIALSGINPVYHDVNAYGAANRALTQVILVGKSGPNAGQVFELIYGNHFSVDSSNQLTISGAAVAASSTVYNLKVGYRASLNKTSNEHIKISSITELENEIGSPVSYNPLGFGAYLNMTNSQSTANVIALKYSATPSAEFTSALSDILAVKEDYAIAPVTSNFDVTEVSSHCTTMSSPTNKKERIAFINKEIAYNANPLTLTSSAKNTLAEGIRDTNSAYSNRRLFSTFPDCAYVLENRLLTTLKPTWIKNSFDYTCTKDFGDTDKMFGLAKLATSVKASASGKTYKAGTLIDETVWLDLYNSGYGSGGFITAYVPVPGFYFNAVVAGQVIAKRPEQPLTNSPIAGIAEVFGSQDVFSTADLNKMAEGGTYIMTQDTKGGPVICRHQRSTDVTSVALSELSITTALDYTAKFLRKALKPYIGKYTITPNFIKLLNTVLVGTGLFLVRDLGVLNDLKVGTVVQDDISPDTIRAEVSALVKFPVNYIKITLLF